MPRPFDWWNRIRRVVGPPGAPTTRAAVPTAVGAAQRAELAAVFAHVDDLEVELRHVEQRCIDEVRAFDAEAREEAERLLAGARERAATASAEVETRVRRSMDDEAARLRSKAADRADELRRGSSGSISALASDAVARVRSFAESGLTDIPTEHEHLR